MDTRRKVKLVYKCTDCLKKKFQFGPDKCHVLHVVKHQKEYQKVEHFVDGWQMSEVQNIHTGEVHIEKSYDGEHAMSAEGIDKYLEQILSSDSTNIKIIEIIETRELEFRTRSPKF